MNQRIALIFGGSRGIGAAAMKAMAADGFAVAYTYQRNAVKLSKNGSSAPCTGYQADIRDERQVARVFADVKREFGDAPTSVIVSAGINVPPGPVGQFPTERFREVVEINLVGAFNVLREAAQNVKDGGTIIALTTTLVRFPLPGVGPYCATKAAVECLVRSLAKELAPRKVRVNAVAPGPVDTDLFRAGKNPEAIRRSAALSPFNRVGQPDEIGTLIAFLASDKASWIHGQIVQANGGLI